MNADMQLCVFIKTLWDLKLRIEETISLAETKHDGDLDDILIEIVKKCKKNLSEIRIALTGCSTFELANNYSETDCELSKDDEFEQNFDTFDYLDNEEYDDFFNSKSTNNQAAKAINATSKENIDHSYNEDSVIAIKPKNELQTEKKEKYETLVDEDDSFNDFDFDDKALMQIEQAEKSALENVLHVDEDEPDNIHQPSDQSYHDVLKQHFGYSTFRPKQWKIINSVLNDKRDNCVIMATGYGKSLTFQFPSVYTKHTSVIISPLISLMEDQVHGLKASNIEACFLGSAQSEMARVRNNMFSGHYRLVYVTPEFATTAISDFKRLDKEVGIDLIAIDEAHCVSQWGHDFRDSYRKLGILKQEFPKIPILALTATATFEVQKDICSSLKLVNPSMTCTGFDRPNLFLSVNAKSGDITGNLKNLMHKEGYKFSFDGPTIIYCQTKKVTEEVTMALTGLGVSCLPYHASLSFASRRKAHKSFLKDEIQVVIATVAFGMGIDKPDVRRVIHYGAPKDIESYYQEIGRAGRDGLPSVCTAIFSNADFNLSRHFISEISNDKFRDHKMKMLRKMEQYLTTSSCRRRVLLSYFETGNLEDFGGTENCCDNCSSKFAQLRHGATISQPSDQPVDYKKEAADLLRTIDAMGNRFGMQIPVQVLSGSKMLKVKAFKLNKMYGAGKYKNAKFWSALGKALIYEGYLRDKPIQGSYGATVEITPMGRTWLNKVETEGDECHLFISPTRELLQEKETLNKKPVVVTLNCRSSQALPSSSAVTSNSLLMSPKAPSVSATQSVPSPLQPPLPPVDEKTARLQKELYIKLLKARSSISQETSFTPHNIASNKVLLDMAKFRPSIRSSLLKLEDFSEVKAERFGDKFLELIKSFCSQNDLKMDDFPIVSNMADENLGLVKDDIMKITETQRQSYIMFVLQKQSLEEVASCRGLKVSTVITHLCEAIKLGLSVDVRQLGLTEKLESLITKAVLTPPNNGGISSLTRIKDLLPDHVEYNHIKIVIALLVQKHGQEVNSNGELALCKGTSLSQQSMVINIPDEEKVDLNITATSETPKNSLKRQRTTSPFPYISVEASTSFSEYSEPKSSKLAPNLQKSASETQSSTWLQSESQSSQNTNQSSSQTSSRKLPLWLAASANKVVLKKKMKSNSLFK